MSTGFCGLNLVTRLLIKYYVLTNKICSLLLLYLVILMSSNLKTRLCTCQKFCQAPPEGKAVPLRTWYRHAAQCVLEEEMDLGVREAQQR